MPPDKSRIFSAWMSGYFNRKLGYAWVDLNAFARNIANVKQWCTSYPNETGHDRSQVGDRKTKSVSAMITYLKLRHRRMMAACVLSLAALTIPVKAQVIVDLSVITCGQYGSKDRDTQDVIAAWMSGYYNAAKNQSMVDLSRFDRNRKAVEKYCKTHKLETLMSAIQRTAY